MAAQDADALLAAGPRQWGTDESKFNKILVNRSFAQLRATFDAFKSKAGKSILDVIDAEMGGDLAKALSAVCQCIVNKQAYFAQLLYNSIKVRITQSASESVRAWAPTSPR